MTRKKTEQPVKPDFAQCWVCLERGNPKMYPVGTLQDCGNGTWRCKSHRGSTILDAGKKYDEKKRESSVIRRFRMTGSLTFDVEIVEESI